MVKNTTYVHNFFKNRLSQSVNLTHAWKASIVELKGRNAHAQSSDWVAATESGSGQKIYGSEITFFTLKRAHLRSDIVSQCVLNVCFKTEVTLKFHNKISR